MVPSGTFQNLGPWEGEEVHNLLQPPLLADSRTDGQSRLGSLIKVTQQGGGGSPGPRVCAQGHLLSCIITANHDHDPYLKMRKQGQKG